MDTFFTVASTVANKLYDVTHAIGAAANIVVGVIVVSHVVSTALGYPTRTLLHFDSTNGEKKKEEEKETLAVRIRRILLHPGNVHVIVLSGPPATGKSSALMEFMKDVDVQERYVVMNSRPWNIDDMNKVRTETGKMPLLIIDDASVKFSDDNVSYARDKGIMIVCACNEEVVDGPGICVIRTT